MIEKFILKFGIAFGILAFPTLFKKPNTKIWISLFLLNGLNNFLFDLVLVKTKKIKYPVRLLPKIFKVNIVYDLLVCPYLSVWFCQSTYNSNLKDILKKLTIFSLPQAIYEVLLESKTNSLKFKNNWSWWYSLYLVFIVKILSRSLLELLKKTSKQSEMKST